MTKSHSLRSSSILVILATMLLAGGCTLATSKPMKAEPEPAKPPETKVVTKEVVLAAKTLFAFDSAELTDAGKQRIRKLVEDAGGDAAGPISVTGHADRIGDEEYNLNLSQRRADSVARYMRQVGAPADAVTAIGKGETEPVVQCNNQNWDALVQCLQPNRRVVIEYPVTEETEVIVEDE